MLEPVTIHFAVPSVVDDLVERLDQGCRAIENWCPAGLLLYDWPSKKPLPAKRLTYLRRKVMKGGRAFALGNGREAGRRRGEYVFIDPVAVSFGGKIYPGRPVMNLMLSLQPKSWAHCEQIVVAVGDALGAYFATAMPPDSSLLLHEFASWKAGHVERELNAVSIPGSCAYHEAVIGRAEILQARLDASGLHLPDHSKMNLLRYREPDHPAQPEDLAWLNYWSKETCAYLGGPNLNRDADLLAYSYQTSDGAWLLKLTEDPLDLNRPDHLAALVHTYERFPKMGLCMVGQRS